MEDDLMSDDQRVAVWTVRYHIPYVEVFDNERDAADYAAAIADSGNAAVVGVQFPDGRTTPIHRWEAYAEAEYRLSASQEEQAAQAAAHPPSKRRVQAPFGLGDAMVDPGDPDWVGVR
jgi:hypothetical protein